jgi:hypothetical protein
MHKKKDIRYYHERGEWGGGREKVITINSICIYVYTPPFCVYTRRRITTNIPPHTHPFNSLNKLIKKGGGRERWSQYSHVTSIDGLGVCVCVCKGSLRWRWNNHSIMIWVEVLILISIYPAFFWKIQTGEKIAPKHLSLLSNMYYALNVITYMLCQSDTCR